jgi:hydrogenase maturation factor
MCFNIPKKIISIKNNKATLEDTTVVDMSLLVTECQAGDYVYVSEQFAIQKIPRQQAQQSRKIIKQQL